MVCRERGTQEGIVERLRGEREVNWDQTSKEKL